MSDIIKTTQSSGLKLDEYNGSFSLTSVWQAKDGAVKPNWCKVEVYDKETKEKKEKSLPVKIYLGNRERAIEILKELLGELGGEVNEPESDVPF